MPTIPVGKGHFRVAIFAGVSFRKNGPRTLGVGVFRFGLITSPLVLDLEPRRHPQQRARVGRRLHCRRDLHQTNGPRRLPGDVHGRAKSVFDSLGEHVGGCCEPQLRCQRSGP